MFNKKALLVVVAATSLMATAIVESSQAPVQAKPVGASRPIVLGPLGPVCPTPATIKLISAGATRTYSLPTLTACSSYNPSPSPAPTVTPTPRPSSTPTSSASPTPSPIVPTFPVATTYALGTLPTGVEAIIAGDVLTISAKSNAVDANLEIVATHTYADPNESSFIYTDSNNVQVPISVKAASAPTCQIFTISTSVNTAVDVPLAYDALRAGGCKGTDGYGALTYSIASVANGTATVATPSTPTAYFTPAGGFQTPADNSTKATFVVVATDEYGQASQALDQYGAATANATITVNVSEPRDCGGWVPKTETIFNNPLAGSSRDGKLANSRFAITNRINNMIDCAPVGSTIAMSWFSFTDDNMVNHLIQAYRAGVNVRILVNSHATKPSSSSFTAVNTLRSVLGSNITDATANATENPGSWFGSCDSGCLTPTAPAGLVFPDDSEGEYPALHSKFFLITRAGSAKNVVGISSVNPTFEQAKVGFNNASVAVNDKVLFNSANQYYADLANAARGAGKATAYRQLATSSKTTSYYVYPKGGSDDTLSMLRNIKCMYVEGGKTKRTQIYVNMFVFTRNAPAMELWKKAFSSKANNGGCNVHIIYTDMDQRIKALNTKTNSYDFIPNGDKPSAWGVADCLSTYPKNAKGKTNKLTAPGMVYDSTTGRMVAAKTCKFGSLQGAMPTINKAGGYCWYNAKLKSTGGSLDMCVSTPLKITALDKADNRAKLEPVCDASGSRWYSHQKYIAIDGMYGTTGKTKTHQQIVISGTPNITSPGMRWNDEIMTFTTSAEIYAQYVDNYNQMKSAIANRPGPSSACNPNGASARW
jgi:phosphatidylserine/phosphatidylglycerophosphate/cardiolipin synthase-like enzyme